MSVVFALIAASTAAWRFMGDEEEVALERKGPKLGLVKLEGPILDAEKIVKFVNELYDNEEVKGVILRVNSPGGAFGPSQEIHRALLRLAAKKPLYCSMSSLGASGGYYAAVACQKIFAMPGTITGSIGVKAQYPNVQALIEKLGVSFTTFTTGKLKDAGSPFKALTPEEKAYLEALILDLHQQFVEDVAKGRKFELPRAEAVADGRALTGRQALALGLVDELGGLFETTEDLKKTCGLSGKVPLLKGPKDERRFLERFASSLNIPDPSGLAGLAANLATSDAAKLQIQ